VPEWNGTRPTSTATRFVGPGLGGHELAGLNMDMVGENSSCCHSRLQICRTPDSLPTAMDELVGAMAQMVDRLSIRTPRGSAPNELGAHALQRRSDHMMLIDRKIPAVMFSHEPTTRTTPATTRRTRWIRSSSNAAS